MFDLALELASEVWRPGRIPDNTARVPFPVGDQLGGRIHLELACSILEFVLRHAAAQHLLDALDAAVAVQPVAVGEIGAATTADAGFAMALRAEAGLIGLRTTRKHRRCHRSRVGC